MDICVKVENKYEAIVTELKQQISKGLLSGQIPGQRQLADMFNVNVITLRKALTRLEDEGLLEKHPCKGVFVRKNLDIQKHETVALLLYSHGHLYQEMTALVSRHLQDRGFYSMLLDTDWRQTGSEQLKEQIIRLISSSPAGFIIDGYRNFPFEMLREYRRRISSLVFMFRNHAPDIEADNVLTDYAGGGDLGTEYLLNRGRRKILFVMPPPPRLYYDAVLALEGARKALDRHRIELTPEMIIDYQEELFENGHYELLEERLRQYRPDAIFAFGDYMARPFYRIAAAMGLGIPDDIAILGYYNTQWATSYRIPMSSVCVNGQQIAIQAAECLISRTINPKQPWRNIIVEPAIVERLST
ncbi:MAG: GntR family transcriptional regulator [Victivallaceae bacterium]|jgi:LacI family transcriptional regulator